MEAMGDVLRISRAQRERAKLTQYLWIVWRDCRIAGHVKAYSEREALVKSKEKFGDRIFVERAAWNADQESSPSCGTGKN